MLSLLNPEFESLKGREVRANDKLRQELAKHFVQRRRQDIKEWQQQSKERIDGFPERLTTELTYKLDADWINFFESVQDYCQNLVSKVENNESDTGKIIWYAVLALLRCVSSSPEAAHVALLHRLEKLNSQEVDDKIAREVADGDDMDSETDDVTPAANIEDTKELKALLAKAEKLRDPSKDPKFKRLLKHVKDLLADGFYPVIFCRYVATADYVARELQKAIKTASVSCVTGELVPEERKERVEELGSKEKRILVATDCLSEGINLQQHFTAVVHYDLAWNPGQDNPVDGFILKVILQKSKDIQKRLGVVVPVPEDSMRINEALIKAAVFKRHGPAQRTLFDLDDPSLVQLEEKWTSAMEKAKRSRTIFAQAAMHPDEVYKYWKQEKDALGSHEDLEFFSNQAAALLGCHLEPNYWKQEKDALGSHEDLEFFSNQAAALLGCHLEPNASKPNLFSVPVNTFKDKTLVLRLEDEGIKDGAVLNFNELHRASPFVSLLAESFVEAAMSGSDESAIARCAVTTSDNVDAVTSVYLLRMRYQMFIRYRNELKRCLLAEEILPVSVACVKNLKWSSGHELVELINDKSRSNLTAALSQYLRSIPRSKSTLKVAR